MTAMMMATKAAMPMTAIPAVATIKTGIVATPWVVSVIVAIAVIIIAVVVAMMAMMPA
jgi:hypothetical protein